MTPCSAIIAEGRNDENQVIAQIHVAFLRAHNRLIDQGYKFKQARELMRWRHQWIVVHEFLPEVLDPDVYADVFRPTGKSRPVLRSEECEQGRHAGRVFGCGLPLRPFPSAQGVQHYPRRGKGTGVQQYGWRPPRRTADRDRSHDLLAEFPHRRRPAPTGQPRTTQPVANISRKIDSLLSSGLFALPIPGAAPEGSAILAKRNIQRARGYGLPSGQAVAGVCSRPIPFFTNAEIAACIPRLAALMSPLSSGLSQGELPLWLYMLAESQIVHNGAKLGPVGSRIVAEVIGGLLAADNRSYYHSWTPEGGCSARRIC